MWHPGDEAEATSDMAVLIEWLRAMRGQNDANPQAIRSWAASDPDGFSVEFAQCLGEAGEGAATRDLRIAALFDQWTRIRPPV